MEDNLIFFLYEDNSIGYIKKNAIKEKNLKKYLREEKISNKYGKQLPI